MTKPAEMQKASSAWRKKGLTVALVPTMGALHAGHAALIRRAAKIADRVVVSAYVNPTQFNSKGDFEKYPKRTLTDMKLATQAGTDVLFRPRNLYAADASTWVEETVLSRGRCGARRPGHFRGVATVVVKLFGIIQPDLAIFGEKDRQQCEMVERVVRDLCLPVRILRHPTVRDSDGLPMSSRNLRLNPGQRKLAGKWATAVRLAARKGPRKAPSILRNLLRRLGGIRLEYAEVVGRQFCVAAWIGKIRLIDHRSCGGKT